MSNVDAGTIAEVDPDWSTYDDETGRGEASLVLIDGTTTRRLTLRWACAGTVLIPGGRHGTWSGVVVADEHGHWLSAADRAWLAATFADPAAAEARIREEIESCQWVADDDRPRPIICNDVECVTCGAKPRRLTCEGCGAWGDVTDCGHQSQPRPLAAYDGHHVTCDGCAIAIACTPDGDDA